jgi:hypothetical protein
MPTFGMLRYNTMWMLLQNCAAAGKQFRFTRTLLTFRRRIEDYTFLLKVRVTREVDYQLMTKKAVPFRYSQ